MELSMRSMLTAGVAALTASAVVFAPTITPPSTPLPDVHRAAVTLAAAVQPMVQLSSQVANPAAAAAGPVVAPAAASTLASGNGIMNFYWTVEPWVQYGFELATWAVGYVPFAGYFSGLIMVAYYTGEPVVQSLFQSAQYLVDGNWAAIPNTLANGLYQAGQNFVQQGLNWLLGYFPPFPPFPVFDPTAAASFATAALAAEPTSIQQAAKAALAPIERLLNSTIATFQKDLADTEATIKNAFFSKALPKTTDSAATDTTTVEVPAALESQTTDTTDAGTPALRTAKPRLRAIVDKTVDQTAALAKSSPAALPGTGNTHPQSAANGAAKAGPSATKANRNSGKPGHATHTRKGTN
jgi:hypothetical protein